MSFFSRITRHIWLVAAIGYGTVVQAQMFVDSEPNDSCFAAQDLGVVSPPATVSGSLDSSFEFPDVDFFLIHGNPNEVVLVDLEGTTTGAGTLQDPYLGFFNSDCGLLALDDDGGEGLNSRLVVSIPENGVVVLGVTQCCDSTFVGGGEGSYVLSLSEFFAIDSIVGRVVNATTGEPLSGSEPHYASAQLYRCNSGDCSELIGFQASDSDGRFSFDSDQYGNPLTVGSYQVQASASGFEFLVLAPFDATEGEAVDLGDIMLSPQELIGSISGRLVDAVSGVPLVGNVPPYPFVSMQRCDEAECFDVAGAVPDQFGRFRFDGLTFFISPGTFRLYARADDYNDAVSPQFTVGALEDVNIGRFGLTPSPIQFGAIQPCEIPAGGGTCEYSVEVKYRGPASRYLGKAWSIVEVYAPASYRLNRFQVGRDGAERPRPENVILKRGESATVRFHLDVTPAVADGSTICAYIVVGEAPEAQFNGQGDRFIFCSVKQSGELAAMPQKAGRKFLQERQGQTAR